MEVPIRATVVFFLLWGVTRAVGKRELSQMSAFELLLLVTAGDFVQQGVTQEDYSVTGAALAVGTITFWVVLFSYVAFRFKPARRALEGEPVVVVRRGRPMLEAMRIERLTLDEVLGEARQQGISDLGDVDVAILDPDGKFSFITGGERHLPDETHTA